MIKSQTVVNCDWSLMIDDLLQKHVKVFIQKYAFKTEYVTYNSSKCRHGHTAVHNFIKNKNKQTKKTPKNKTGLEELILCSFLEDWHLWFSKRRQRIDCTYINLWGEIERHRIVPNISDITVRSVQQFRHKFYNRTE